MMYGVLVTLAGVLSAVLGYWAGRRGYGLLGLAMVFMGLLILANGIAELICSFKECGL